MNKELRVPISLKTEPTVPLIFSETVGEGHCNEHPKIFVKRVCSLALNHVRVKLTKLEGRKCHVEIH